MHARQVILGPWSRRRAMPCSRPTSTRSALHERANKTQVRQAIEEIFGVRVEGVRTAWVKPKPKRRGVSSGTAGAGRRRS